MTHRQIHVLDGDDWELVDVEACTQITGCTSAAAFLAGADVPNAIPARVPGDVHDDLERAGRLPDLWYATQSTQAQWVPRRNWWYRKRFTLGQAWQGRRVWLELDGIDYAAEVWLNGQKLGDHEGSFIGARFEISDRVNHTSENILVVALRHAPETILEKLFLPRSQTNRQLAMDAVTRDLARWKSRTLTGWDWGTPLWSMGLWQRVRLVGTLDITLRDANVVPRLDPPYNTATLAIMTRADARMTRSVKLQYQITCLTAEDNPIHAEQTITLQPGEQTVTHEIRLDSPRLWWPNGLGDPHRYTLQLSVTDELTGQTLDETSTGFGVRNLKIIPNPSAEDYRVYLDHRANAPNDVWQEHGVSSGTRPIGDGHQPAYLMVINGQHVFARGTNWIPADLMFGRVSDEKLEHLIRLAALGNYNIFRVWGGGLIETPKFYELCDRYGLMVWQEMPHAGRRPLETPQALHHAATQQRAVMRRLINHPSLVRYGFGNELYLRPEDSAQVAQFLNLCAEIDPTRPAQTASPVTPDQRHAPHWFDFSNDYATYNTGHPLTVGADNPAEWTEYGASGAAGVETLERIMPASSRWPIRADNADWRWHNGFGAYLGDDWLLPQFYRGLFGELPDLATEVRVSQWAQAEGLRYASQAHRRAKWHRSGAYAWTFNEPWPNAAHGCVVEYFGRTKMAYDYTQRSNAPIDVSAVYSGLTVTAGQPLPVQLFITSDRTENTPECVLSINVFDTLGRPLGQQSQTLTITAQTTQRLGPLDITLADDATGSVVLLDLYLTDQAGECLSQQTYTFAAQAPGPPRPTPMRPLLDAPRAELAIDCEALPFTPTWGTNARRHRLHLHNPGDVPALFVALQSNTKTPGVYFQNNRVTVAPHDTRQCDVITFHTPTNQPITLRAQGWNTTPTNITLPTTP